MKIIKIGISKIKKKIEEDGILTEIIYDLMKNILTMVLIL